MNKNYFDYQEFIDFKKGKRDFEIDYVDNNDMLIPCDLLNKAEDIECKTFVSRNQQVSVDFISFAVDNKSCTLLYDEKGCVYFYNLSLQDCAEYLLDCFADEIPFFCREKYVSSEELEKLGIEPLFTQKEEESKEEFYDFLEKYYFDNVEKNYIEEKDGTTTTVYIVV